MVNPKTVIHVTFNNCMRSTDNLYVVQCTRIRHFRLECGDFTQVKENSFHVENMKQLFQDIHIDRCSIMTF